MVRDGLDMERDAIEVEDVISPEEGEPRWKSLGPRGGV